MFLDLRQSPEYGQYLKKIGWISDRQNNFRIYVRHLPVLGNFIKVPRPPSCPSRTAIDKIAKKYRPFAVAIDCSPTKTLRLNITPPLKEILSQMKKDTRYEIRKAQKNKIIVRRSYDIDSFIKMWHDNALHRGFWIPFKKEIKALYEAFGKNSYLLLAYQIPLRLRSGQADPEFPFDFAQGKQIPNSKSPISGALILVSHKIAYYFHAASTSEGRQLSAPSLIVWEAMKLAKEKGCKTFDFEGILDPRDKNTNKWGGFTHFKKGFGGREVVYPLTITKYYNPIVKFLFSFFG